MIVEPVTLEGTHVRLEPLAESHHAQLSEIGLDEELWRWIPTRVTTPEEMMNYIRLAQQDQAAGTALPFATIDRASNRAIGSTRYMNIAAEHRRLEIGATWIAKSHQRTLVNVEAKYLMLRHAFETLDCQRVELKTDSRNRRSRNAIQRLGAKQEGIFRNHMITSTGRIRHTVYFSITIAEWPQVKANLESKLGGARDREPLRRVETLSDSQVEDLHRLYQNEWWTRGRTLEDTRRMLEATRVMVAFADASNDRLVAFARANTDETFKALIFDVIVDPDWRKRALGIDLMNALLAHPALAGVRHIELYCRPEMTRFYERWGFKSTGPEAQFLRRESS
ncbi:MAG TPA: GNAT family N-acetyltransferase [Bryobacteraceae bacterium]|nr:GNAT family N-acetyltransferase [Bryobacteraceae bacterium]